ncbi:Uncharacterised protein [uncultured archaeon]|nr:Uncharacterised protein [uncultured archaeon]
MLSSDEAQVDIIRYEITNGLLQNPRLKAQILEDLGMPDVTEKVRVSCKCGTLKSPTSTDCVCDLSNVDESGMPLNKSLTLHNVDITLAHP